MHWHEFIFSEEKKYKVLRHLVFWMSWWLYFLACYYLLKQPIPGSTIKPFSHGLGHHLAINTLLMLSLSAITCYAFIYFILPYFINGKWLKAFSLFIFSGAFLFASSHILFWQVFPLVDSAFGYTGAGFKGAKFWPAVNFGLIPFTKVVAAAAIIKYLKYWWLKLKESQRLEKEKINAELQLLKAQVHPDFLFKTLNNIYNHALSSSPRTSGMLLKLSDLLSYMLYECDWSTVPLEKEIEMMKEYMQLEKIRYHDDPEIQVNIKGKPGGKSIAPFILLPFIENSFKHCGHMTEQFWINMDIRVEGDNFSMKLTNGISEGLSDQTLLNTNGLANVQKRLSLLYPGNHELKMTTEQEMFIVFLNIRLIGCAVVAREEEETNPATTKNKKGTISNLKYASE